MKLEIAQIRFSEREKINQKPLNRLKVTKWIKVGNDSTVEV